MMRNFGMAKACLTAGVWLLAAAVAARADEPAPRKPSARAPSALEQELDRIERENAAKPFIVTRTKWLVATFERAKLRVKPDDTFVDAFSESHLIAQRRTRRCRAFGRATPGLEDTTDWTRGTHGCYVAQLDPSHTCPDWESILALGPRGLAERARARRRTAVTDDERLFLDCIAEVYDAMAGLFARWSRAADTVGNAACAATLKALSERPPETLREALQLMLLYDRCQDTEGEYVRTQGLFDRLYIRFYRADLAAGRETRDSEKAYVRALFDVFYRQGHPNGKNIAFGGYGRDGKPVWNELTEIAFELHHELNRINPKLTYRYGAKTPTDQLEKVTRCVADGRTSIVFLNEEISFESFRRRGKRDGDAADAVLVGCYEPAIMGREVIASMSAWINLAKPLEAVLNNGRAFDGYPVGPACALPADGDAFEREYLRQLAAFLDDVLAKTRTYEEHGYELNPSPILSGSFRDAVVNARDAYAGGLKYNQSGVMCAGLATVADSLAAVRHLVDETKAVTMAELAAALKADWKDREELRLRARHGAPKWGNNDNRADAAAKRVYDFASARVNATKNGHGGTYQAGFWSIDDDLVFGRRTAATPEGRRAGETLSRNNGATAGCGREGPTALMLSCAKLDQANSPDGFIFDLMLPASVAKRADSAKRIAGVLRTFAAKGGHCIHVNCFDSATLRDAQAHPEKYPDLQVRVCGWNVLWSNLSKAEQDHFIATAAAQE